MSPLDVAVKMKALLVAGGFPSTHITARNDVAAFSNLRLPAVLIQVGGATADPEEPGFVRQTFAVTLAVAVAGDAIGENVIVGANGADGLGDLEPMLKTLLRDLGKAEGVNLQLVAESDAAEIAKDEVPYAAIRTYTFAAFCVTDAA